jgi:hypothetical protein
VSLTDIDTRRADRSLTAVVLGDVLTSFDHVRLSVTGDCMRPLLAPGERVLLAAAARRAPRLGDVVLVRHREGLRLHRLIWRAGRAWRTKGDRSLHFDPRVTPRDVLGVVIGAEDGRDVRRGWRRATLRSLWAGAWARLRASR